jgi:hypothetical protein
MRRIGIPGGGLAGSALGGMPRPLTSVAHQPGMAIPRPGAAEKNLAAVITREHLAGLRS